MFEPDLISLIDGESDGEKWLLEMDRNTKELYFNKNRVITAIKLYETERSIAWLLAGSTLIIALCNIFTIIVQMKENGWIL